MPAAHVQVFHLVHLIVQGRLHRKQSAGNVVVHNVLHPAPHHSCCAWWVPERLGLSFRGRCLAGRGRTESGVGGGAIYRGHSLDHPFLENADNPRASRHDSTKRDATRNRCTWAHARDWDATSTCHVTETSTHDSCLTLLAPCPSSSSSSSSSSLAPLRPRPPPPRPAGTALTTQHPGPPAAPA